MNAIYSQQFDYRNVIVNRKRANFSAWHEKSKLKLLIMAELHCVATDHYLAALVLSQPCGALINCSVWKCAKERLDSHLNVHV